MKTSEVGIKLIRHFEGMVLEPYKDPISIITIGVGHVISDPITKQFLKGDLGLEKAKEMFKGFTEEDAINLLSRDLIKYENIVNRLITVPLKQHQFDALVSHTFNCGVSETLYKLINTRPLNSESIAIWWRTKYITANGIKQNGLVKRRSVEYELFNTGKLNLK